MSEQISASELAEKVAEASLNVEASAETVNAAMKSKDFKAVKDAVLAHEKAEKAHKTLQAQYERAVWEAENGERVEASNALQAYLQNDITGIPEVAKAFELGVTGFTVKRAEDGTVSVVVNGAKAPGSPRASGNGTGDRPRKVIFDTQTETETPTREWLETYPHGDTKATEAAIAARSGKVTSKTGKEYIPNFQADLKRVLSMPEIAGRFELRDKVKAEA